MTMTEPTCPETGAPMHRGTRPLTLSHRGESITFDMPGWYREGSGDGLHSWADLEDCNRMLRALKARAGG